MTATAQLKELVKRFEEAAERYSEFGATDTEPDGVFQVQLVRAFKGKNPDVPTTARKWQLYSDMAGNEAAAAELGRCAKECVELIKSVPLGESEVVRSYLEDYCWRVDW